MEFSKSHRPHVEHHIYKNFLCVFGKVVEIKYEFLTLENSGIQITVEKFCAPSAARGRSDGATHG